jgi:hypothetical protein
MNYRFLVLAIFIFGVTFQALRQIYAYDKGEFRIAKILNILITILMLWYVSGPNNTIIEIISDFDGFKENFQIESGPIGANITFISKIVHNVVNVFMIVVIFQLTRRNKNYRKYFIYMIPLLLVLMTLELNRELFRSEELKYSGLYLLGAFVWNILKFLTLFLIYNSKVFKRFMCFDDKSIKRLIFEKNNVNA